MLFRSDKVPQFICCLIHNIIDDDFVEFRFRGKLDFLKPGRGGELVRAAGASAQVLGQEGKYVLVRLQSGEVRMILGTCRATVGVVGNEQHGLVNLGKAGRSRWKGIRPTVRGSVMNPNDHPHGGGEGKAPVGLPSPLSIVSRSRINSSN